MALTRKWCSAQGKDRRSAGASEHGRDPARAAPALGTLCSKSAPSCLHGSGCEPPLMARCPRPPRRLPPAKAPAPLAARAGRVAARAGRCLQAGLACCEPLSPPPPARCLPLLIHQRASGQPRLLPIVAAPQWAAVACAGSKKRGRTLCAIASPPSVTCSAFPPLLNRPPPACRRALRSGGRIRVTLIFLPSRLFQPQRFTLLWPDPSHFSSRSHFLPPPPAALYTLVAGSESHYSSCPLFCPRRRALRSCSRIRVTFLLVLTRLYPQPCLTVLWPDPSHFLPCAHSPLPAAALCALVAGSESLLSRAYLPPPPVAALYALVAGSESLSSPCPLACPRRRALRSCGQICVIFFFLPFRLFQPPRSTLLRPDPSHFLSSYLLACPRSRALRSCGRMRVTFLPCSLAPLLPSLRFTLLWPDPNHFLLLALSPVPAAALYALAAGSESLSSPCSLACPRRRALRSCGRIRVTFFPPLFCLPPAAALYALVAGSESLSSPCPLACPCSRALRSCGRIRVTLFFLDSRLFQPPRLTLLWPDPSHSLPRAHSPPPPPRFTLLLPDPSHFLLLALSPVPAAALYAPLRPTLPSLLVGGVKAAESSPCESEAGRTRRVGPVACQLYRLRSSKYLSMQLIT